jgi:hypothetical protein
MSVVVPFGTAADWQVTSLSGAEAVVSKVYCDRPTTTVRRRGLVPQSLLLGTVRCGTTYTAAVCCSGGAFSLVVTLGIRLNSHYPGTSLHSKLIFRPTAEHPSHASYTQHSHDIVLQHDTLFASAMVQQLAALGPNHHLTRSVSRRHFATRCTRHVLRSSHIVAHRPITQTSKESWTQSRPHIPMLSRPHI